MRGKGTHAASRWLALIALLAAAPAPGAEWSSSLGFRAEVPDSWLILTREELAENPDLFASIELPGADPEFVAAIKQRIASGQIEFLFKLRAEPDEFADNVNAMKNLARLPASAEEAAEACAGLPDALAASAGRPLALHACELRRLGDRIAFYADFDGVVVGTRSAQYQIQRSPSVVLVVTATARSERFAPISGELDAIAASIEFD